ncbi:hypothetical protein EXN66_Car001940 [Channa argus]|uniref:Uncharacterized protein n=1 Tax=Channa argus TaxID=215402 RepID=A0A6G1P893_CHAAH|nr:hypothetical protein EXN66_Car001940 [Channa argus]
MDGSLNGPNGPKGPSAPARDSEVRVIVCPVHSVLIGACGVRPESQVKQQKGKQTPQSYKNSSGSEAHRFVDVLGLRGTFGHREWWKN